MLCPTFQSLSPVLRYSNLYFTVHSLKVCTWGGGFHSTSRGPRSPGSVIWTSRGGATTLKTKQRVKPSVKVKKTNTKQSWNLLVWYVGMICWNAAAGCGGKCCWLQPGVFNTLFSTNNTSSAPAHPTKTSFTGAQRKHSRTIEKAHRMPLFDTLFQDVLSKTAVLGWPFMSYICLPSTHDIYQPSGQVSLQTLCSAHTPAQDDRSKHAVRGIFIPLP